MTDRIIFPLDVDAIAARAEAAPGGSWEAFTDTLWIPWSADTDDETDDQFRSGRWLAVREGGWHTGSEDPPPELWAFLAAARDDVLALAAEVRRLRAAIASATMRLATPGRMAERQPTHVPGAASRPVIAETAR